MEMVFNYLVFLIMNNWMHPYAYMQAAQVEPFPNQFISFMKPQ